jgi:hypothetical protein
MLGAEHFLADRQRALYERPRSGKVPLAVKLISEVIEARCRIGVLGADRLIVDRQLESLLAQRHALIASAESAEYLV